MRPLLFLSAALPAALLLASPAAAQGGRYVTPPPVMLSPDLTSPWISQLKPGGKPIYRVPRSEAAIRMPEEPTITVNPAQPGTQHAALTPHGNGDPKFLPTVVDYDGPYAPGTVVIDTSERLLYLVEENGRARRYGVGVGRPGFEWAGTHQVTRKAEWPDWHPPAEMRQRQPHLPLMMPGGPKNPLGARALYLGSTLYRIHGTSEPWTIGSAVSSGCIRMRNEDVTDLYDRVPVGAKVIVM